MTYTLITIVLCAFAIILGISMILLPTLPSKISRHYKISKCILAFAYIYYAVAKLVTMYTKQQMRYDEFLPYTGTSVAVLIMILFYLSLMVLLNPYYLKWRRVSMLLLPYVVLLILYHGLGIYYDDVTTPTIESFFKSLYEPMVFIRLWFFIELIAIQIISLSHFYKVRAAFRSHIYNVYSDDKIYPLKWISYAYYTYLALSIFNLFSYLLISGVYWIIYIFLQMAFYAIFAVRYIQYNMSLNMVARAMKEDPETPRQQDTSVILNKMNIVKMHRMFEKEVLNKKLYLKHGITIDELAAALRSNRTYLSLYINRTYNMNFNQYINKLRIEYAKNLMQEQPSIPLNSLADMVGFSDLASFSRYFRRYSGCAPSQWRENEIL